MTRTAQHINTLEALLACLSTPILLVELGERLATAENDWNAHGYPSGGTSDGGRSADRSSSTERAATTPDQIGPTIAAIHDAIDQTLAGLRGILAGIAWLRPTTIDPMAPAKTATCLDCQRVVAGLPDARNRDGIVVHRGDPIKAGRCRECHVLWLASRRAHPTNGAGRDPATGTFAQRLAAGEHIVASELNEALLTRADDWSPWTQGQLATPRHGDPDG